MSEGASVGGAYAYPLLIKQLLHTPLANAPDQQILYRDISRYSYRTLRERIGRLAGALARLGVGHGRTVAVMDWDSHRYLECFFAVPMMGAVLQTVNVRLSPEQVLYTLNHARADVLLVNAEFLPILDIIREQLETVRQFILLTDAGPAEGNAFGIPFAGEYEQLLAAASPEHEFPDFDENTRATTFYTTGTTGAPKGVYFSHRQLVLHTLSVATALGTAPAHGRFGREDVYMPITPMFHVHAWGLPYVATMLGVKQVYPGRYVPDTLLHLIQEHGVSFSHCVPTILHMLLASPKAKEVDLSRWKVVIGGSALPRGLAETALAKGVDIFGGYGLSETCPVLSLAQLDPGFSDTDPEAALGRRIKAGRAIPLVELRTVSEQFQDQPRDGKTQGEVVVRAPWLTQGYLHDDEASAELWERGWLHTRDIGHVDPAGYLQVTDRIKDVIKAGGEWISSLELESLITEHPAVAEVAVIGQKDEKWGEKPLALVVLKPGQNVEEGELRRELRERVHQRVEAGILPRYAVLTQFRFVPALAKTSVGKMDKKAMRQDI
ncbi:MAG: fatty acid--CoA ligase [Rhodocyclaceae bacterium]|nr:fatty acid--CoA ligase [Rhodocyclaceae bacterium]